MQKKKLSEVLTDPQMIIAIAVAIISICALAVSIFQARVMNEQRSLMVEQLKSSAWPRLELRTAKSQQGQEISNYYLLVTNKGIGPAIVEKVLVSYDGNYYKNWWDLFQGFNLSDSIPTHISNVSLKNRVIQSGEELRILGLSNNLELANEFYKRADKIKIQICYKSVFNDFFYHAREGLRGNFTEKLNWKENHKCDSIPNEIRFLQ